MSSDVRPSLAYANDDDLPDFILPMDSVILGLSVPDGMQMDELWARSNQDTGRKVHRLERTLKGEPQLLTHLGDGERPARSPSPKIKDSPIAQAPSSSVFQWSLASMCARLSNSKVIDSLSPVSTTHASTKLKFDNVIEEADFRPLQAPADSIRRCDVVEGRDMQGYVFGPRTSRRTVRATRSVLLRMQLDHTRRFMRKNPMRGSREISHPEEWVQDRRDAMVFATSERTSPADLFKLRVFHKSCSPSFDHFQLKRLMVSDGEHGLYYIEQFPVDNLDNLSTTFTPSPDPRRTARSVVFHFDTRRAKKRRVLGPWTFPGVRQSLEQAQQGFLRPTTSVSFDSPCIYSIAASRHFLVAADSSSSLIIAKMDQHHKISWALCQRSSRQRQQITNCVQIIEGSARGSERTADLTRAVLIPQAELRGCGRLQRAGQMLEASIPRVQRCCQLRRGMQQWRQWHLLSSVPQQLEEPAVPSEPMRRLQLPSRRSQAVRRRQTMDDVAFFPEESSFVQADEIRIAEMSIPPSRNSTTDATSGLSACATRSIADDRADAPSLLPWLRRCPSGTGSGEYTLNPELEDLLPALGLTVLTASNDRHVSEFNLRYQALPKHLTVDAANHCVPVREGFATALPLHSTKFESSHLIPTIELISQWNVPFSCNHIAIHPQKDLMLLVGDDPSSLIFSRKLGAIPQSLTSTKASQFSDGRHHTKGSTKEGIASYLQRMGTSHSGQNLSRPLFIIEGHHDCGFAAAWHPNGFMFATGNDDETLMVWDLRFLRGPQKIFASEITAPRSLVFSPDGSFLVSCESEDSAVIYDVRGGFKEKQTIPFYGACTGATFSPDGESLFLGVAARQGPGGIIELHLNDQLSSTVE